MTWTYNASLLSSTALYRVRFFCGDTDTTDQLVADEEISYLLTQTTSETLAAAWACEYLSRRFARDADKSIGSLSVSSSQRAKAFAARAQELKADDQILAVPFAGGLSISDKQTLDADTDATQPQTRIGQDDNPRTKTDRLPSSRWWWQE